MNKLLVNTTVIFSGHDLLTIGVEIGKQASHFC